MSPPNHHSHSDRVLITSVMLSPLGYDCCWPHVWETFGRARASPKSEIRSSQFFVTRRFPSGWIGVAVGRIAWFLGLARFVGDSTCVANYLHGLRRRARRLVRAAKRFRASPKASNSISMFTIGSLLFSPLPTTTSAVEAAAGLRKDSFSLPWNYFLPGFRSRCMISLSCKNSTPLKICIMNTRLCCIDNFCERLQHNCGCTPEQRG